MRSMAGTVLFLGALSMSSDLLAQKRTTSFEAVEVLPDHIVRRIVADETEQAITRLRLEGKVQEGVIVGTKRWEAGVPITVCYFGGSPAIRRKITAVAATWETLGAAVQFDFGDRNDPRLCRSNTRSDIRIGYSQPGYWSMIGQDSLIYVGQYEQSMNFARFDYAPPQDNEFNRVVLHEFGHALGFEHEHQQNQDGCESEFNWPVIYNYLQGPPNYWSIETIDHNMKSKKYLDGDIKTKFNRNSIMLYTFPVEFYKAGSQSRCYSSGNFALSDGDAQLLRLAYTNTSPTKSASISDLVMASKSLSPSDQKMIQDRAVFYNADKETKALLSKTRAEF